MSEQLTKLVRLQGDTIELFRYAIHYTEKVFIGKDENEEDKYGEVTRECRCVYQEELDAQLVRLERLFNIDEYTIEEIDTSDYDSLNGVEVTSWDEAVKRFEGAWVQPTTLESLEEVVLELATYVLGGE